MRRFVLALLLLAGVVISAPLGAGASSGPTGSRSSDEYGVRNCSQGLQICTEVKDAIGENGAYTGHDEPSLLFYSDTQGSGSASRGALSGYEMRMRRMFDQSVGHGFFGVQSRPITVPETST